MNYIKESLSFIFTIILAVLGISYLRNKKELEKLDNENKRLKLEDEINDEIEKLENTDLDDIISNHNKSIQDRSED